MKLMLAVVAAVAWIVASVEGFVGPASSFAGARLSSATRASPVAEASTVMRTRNCDLLPKTANRKARVVTFSHKRIHKVQQLNLQTKRMYWAEGNGFVRMRLTTKAIKTIDKYGLDKAARKFGVDLTKFRL